MRYDYQGFPCADESIDILQLPVECSNSLKRTGIEHVGDILDMYARIRTDTAIVNGIRMSLECYSTVFRKLIAIDCCPWRNEVETWLIKWVENIDSD